MSPICREGGCLARWGVTKERAWLLIPQRFLGGQRSVGRRFSRFPMLRRVENTDDGKTTTARKMSQNAAGGPPPKAGPSRLSSGLATAPHTHPTQREDFGPVMQEPFRTIFKHDPAMIHNDKLTQLRDKWEEQGFVDLAGSSLRCFKLRSSFYLPPFSNPLHFSKILNDPLDSIRPAREGRE